MSDLFGKKENTLTPRQEQIRYLIFGVLTTVVNYGTFYIFKLLWGDDKALLVNLPAFVLATTFAYITNKIYVFCSRSWKPAFVAREAASFFGARIFSFLFEEAGLYVCVEWLHCSRYAIGPIDGTMIAKIVLSVVAVVMNYFVSKFLVFRKKKEDKQG